MKIMKSLEEGINDKNLFKSVFLAGGAGSGKSFIADNAFLSKGVSPLGVKVSNSDELFEIGLEQAGLPKVMNADKRFLYSAQMAVREFAKKLTAKRQALWVNGMLPIIIDGTGRDYKKITTQATGLHSIGYDTAMLFVNTSLDVALERNAKRVRKVDSEVAEKMWYEVQNNMGKFQNYFGANNFIIVDNNEYLEGSELNKFLNNLFNIGQKLIESPLKNPLGQSIIEYLINTGGKYLTDLPDDMEGVY